jgi:hypothetical protein
MSLDSTSVAIVYKMELRLVICRLLKIVEFELSFHALSFADMSIGIVGVFRLMTSVLPSLL